MKIFTLTLLLLLLCTMSLALANSQAEDSIRLSPRFMRELDNAFSLESRQPQRTADIVTLHPRVLDKDQLHEWIGPIQVDPTQLKLDCSSISIPGLSTADLTQAAYLWKHGQYGILYGDPSTGTAGALTGIDVNALSAYIRPSAIGQRKARELAEKVRPLMERYYPTEGVALIPTSETR